MSPEVIFFLLFLVFILGMLALDLGVFDKHSHEVRVREALIWTTIWVALALCFYLLIMFKGDLIHGIKTIEELRGVIAKFHHPIHITTNDFEEALTIYRKNLSLEFITGYLIEYMLSVDNVFVMILIFISFGVQKMYYKRVLFWGILGAIIMRFLFIFLSSAIIQRFDWVLYIFGAFLVFTGIKMFIERNKEEKIDTANHPVIRIASRYFRLYPNYFRGHFWFRNKKSNYKYYFTPLFAVLLVIEFTDVIFAVDSVPAIFSVTLDPYIVFFSNIFAILGLRSLFFVVSHFISMFRFLKIGLSVLLSFIGLKMIFHIILEEWGFTTAHSLWIILSILAVSILASVIWPEKEPDRDRAIKSLTGEKPTSASF